MCVCVCVCVQLYKYNRPVEGGSSEGLPGKTLSCLHALNKCDTLMCIDIYVY